MTMPTHQLPEVAVTVSKDGRAEIDVAGKRRQLAESSLEAVRDAVTLELRGVAAEQGRPVPVTITDPDGVWNLWVPAEGDPTPRDVEPVRLEKTPPPPPPVPVTVPAEPPALSPLEGGPPRPTFEDLLSQRPDPRNGPATVGWRGGLRMLSGNRWRIAPGPAERARRDAVARVQRTFEGPRTVVVVNPKGGAQKTTAVLMIAQQMGSLRGGYVLAWDNNETRGTLAWRASQAQHSRTVADLVERLRAGGPIRSVSELDRYVRSQGPAQFDVLASDDHHGEQQVPQVSAEDYDLVDAGLGGMYRVKIVDTGNNMRASNWGAAIRKADQLVIMSTIREDTAQSAAWLADGLIKAGREQLLRDAVTVFSQPAEARVDRELRVRFLSYFQAHTRAVLEVPYDPSLVGGGPIDYTRLSEQTRDSWLRVAAAVADGL